MDSSDGGLGRPTAEALNDTADDAHSQSGSSHIGSDQSRPTPNACAWRTSRFHDQECSRYFDCPSHVVERSLSDAGSANEGEDAAPVVDNMARARPEDDHHDISEDGPSTQRAMRSGSTSSNSESGHTAPIDSASQSPATPGPSSADVPGPSQPRQEPSSHIDLPARTSSLPRSPSLSPPSSTRAELNTSLPSTPEATQSPRSHGPEAHYTSGPAPSSPLSQRAGRVPRDFSDILLPRWQPDSEVTLCPICRTQFSFFVRKHHCRKCGRVVCNACSPHRITMPHQYIVRPPGQPRTPQLYANPFTGDDGFQYATGGERVRLCNPCVPDPNNTPPLPVSSPTQRSQRPHHRSQSSTSSSGFAGVPLGGTTGFFLQNPARDAHARGRSITMNAPPHPGSRSQYVSTRSQILAGTPPVYYPASSSPSQYPGSRLRYRPVRESGASSSTQRPLPPTPQIAEEDECPVCHRELPSRTLPNYETLRESHINSCITTHSTYGSGAANTPDTGDGEGPSTASPRSARRTGMFPYVATEKDCVDSAECTICLEEFEVGVPMARLECLCRFHHRCISAWFVNHPGRCPVHQHDSYGY